MIYTIYHIPGVKIGCTSQLTGRMRDQGFTEWEILEEHTDIYLASDREIELQKEYGLPVDKIPYWQSKQNRLIMSSSGGNKNVESGHVYRLSSYRSIESYKQPRTKRRKLTEEDCMQILKDNRKSREVAIDWNVSHPIICSIRNGSYKPKS